MNGKGWCVLEPPLSLVLTQPKGWQNIGRVSRELCGHLLSFAPYLPGFSQNSPTLKEGWTCSAVKVKIPTLSELTVSSHSLFSCRLVLSGSEGSDLWSSEMSTQSPSSHSRSSHTRVWAPGHSNVRYQGTAVKMKECKIRETWALAQSQHLLAVWPWTGY